MILNKILHTHKLDHKNQTRVRDFEKIFLFPSYKYFCRSTQQKTVGIFFNKTKTEVFLENRGHTFLDIE